MSILNMNTPTIQAQNIKSNNWPKLEEKGTNQQLQMKISTNLSPKQTEQQTKEMNRDIREMNKRNNKFQHLQNSTQNE